jgi:hypothetical protein
MRGALYNSGIPNVGIPNVSANLVGRAFSLPHTFRVVALLSFLLLTMAARAADWNEPEQQLARKIVAVTGPGAVALTVENRSSLTKRDNEIIQNGLHAALEGVGLRFVTLEQAAATVAIYLSENTASYVWVAEIRQGASAAVVVMVSVPRPLAATTVRESVPLSLRKTSLWTQADPILDVAVLEENAAPTHIAVLDAEKVALYRWQAGKWQQEQAFGIVHARPWPRDLRGRLIPSRDHLLDVYLPGVICRSAAALPFTLNCRETDDPWPLVLPALSSGSLSAVPGGGSASIFIPIPPMGAFFAPTRNFFTGALTSGIGKFTTVSKFYSAALLPRDKYLLWLFAATDGHVHMVDGVSDQAGRFAWGSDLTSVSTSCGAGWQVLATSAETNADEETGDSIRAYEFPDRDPVAVSAAVDFPGMITALWTEAKGDTAIAVVKNRETGNYEAFRLAVVCSQ